MAAPTRAPMATYASLLDFCCILWVLLSRTGARSGLSTSSNWGQKILSFVFYRRENELAGPVSEEGKRGKEIPLPSSVTQDPEVTSSVVTFERETILECHGMFNFPRRAFEPKSFSPGQARSRHLAMVLRQRISQIFRRKKKGDASRSLSPQRSSPKPARRLLAGLKGFVRYFGRKGWIQNTFELTF
eukprot:323591-Amorphochlora_amoeboformis.AAC.1